jgi:hypothetical protein
MDVTHIADAKRCVFGFAGAAAQGAAADDRNSFRFVPSDE